MVSNILLLMGTLAFGQSGNGRVEGTVTDAQRLALTQAQVTLESMTKGNAARQTVTDGTGRYTFADVVPGQYRLRARRGGFAPGVKDGITITADQVERMDIALGVMDVSESVTVTADNDRLVASRTEIPLRELPVTVQVVSQEVLAQTGATSLIQAVRSIPNTNSVLLYGMYEYFIFRGFGFDNIVGSSVLLDGMRLEGNRMNSQLNGIESVEILKGPASMLYGTEATGGTINLVRKKPLSTPLYEGVLRGGRWGRFGAEFGATGPVKTDRLLYRLDAAFDRADGWRGAGWTRFNTTPALNLRLTNRDQLNFVAGYNEERYDGDAGIPLLRRANEGNVFKSNIFPNVPLDTRYTPPTDFQATRDILPQAFYTHFFNDNLRLRGVFSYRYFDDQYLVTESLSTAPGASVVDREFFYFFHHRRPLQGQTDLRADYRTGRIRHQFVMGYDLLYYQNQTERSSSTLGTPLLPVSIVNPVETFTRQITNFPPSRLDYFTNNINAIYFQDYVRFNNKLTVLGSGRFDHWRRQAFRNNVTNGLEVPGKITNIGQDPFTYRVALNYQANSHVGMYASYGTSFAAQTSLSSDGKELKPESGNQVEIGQRFDMLNGRVTLNTALFRIVKENVTVSRANGIFDQAGRVLSKGFEADLRGRLTEKLTVRASYGFTQAQFDKFELEDGDGVVRNLQGRAPSFVPRHTENLWAIYDVNSKWRVALGQRYISRAPVNNFDYYWMGGYTIWNAAVFFRQQKAEYSVNLDNFTNKQRYFVGSINDYLLYPGSPFSITGTVRFHF